MAHRVLLASYRAAVIGSDVDTWLQKVGAGAVLTTPLVRTGGEIVAQT
jgi:hypothetical protein